VIRIRTLLAAFLSLSLVVPSTLEAAVIGRNAVRSRGVSFQGPPVLRFPAQLSTRMGLGMDVPLADVPVQAPAVPAAELEIAADSIPIEAEAAPGELMRVAGPEPISFSLPKKQRARRRGRSERVASITGGVDAKAVRELSGESRSSFLNAAFDRAGPRYESSVSIPLGNTARSGNRLLPSPGRRLAVAGIVERDFELPSGVSKPIAAPLLRAAGFAALAAASLPVLGVLVPALPGMSSYMGLFTPLVTAGVASLAAARYLGAPETTEPLNEALPEKEAPAGRGMIGRLVQRLFPSFLNFPDRISRVMGYHSDIHARVGDRSPSAFGDWTRSALRAAFFVATAAVLAMFAASIIQVFVQAISLNPEIAGTAVGDALSSSGWQLFFAEQAAFVVVQEALMLLGVFAGLRLLMTRIAKVSAKRAAWAAGLGTMAVNLAYFLQMGYPLGRPGD